MLGNEDCSDPGGKERQKHILSTDSGQTALRNGTQGSLASTQGKPGEYL